MCMSPYYVYIMENIQWHAIFEIFLNRLKVNVTGSSLDIQTHTEWDIKCPKFVRGQVLFAVFMVVHMDNSRHHFFSRFSVNSDSVGCLQEAPQPKADVWSIASKWHLNTSHAGLPASATAGVTRREPQQWLKKGAASVSAPPRSHLRELLQDKWHFSAN